MESKIWTQVKLARNPERITAKSYISELFPDFLELHGDRYYGDDAAIIGGIATLDGMPVTVIGQEKGSTTNEKIKRNFGMPHPEGYRKALRLMKQAEKFGRPVICFVDTQGAYPGIGAEERGQAMAIAENLLQMSQLRVPIISIIIGEGGSGGALALAVADRVYMLENAIYSVLSPEGFATILWKDVRKAPEAAELMKLSAKELHEFGIIDDVISEPEAGVQVNPRMVYRLLSRQFSQDLSELQSLSVDDLLAKRYDKFRKMGVYETVQPEIIEVELIEE
jgi:acetyl-CoA carboxylase, carboxyl transferase, alpha subunit